ncbi:MAG: STAS domain-containing protein [Luteolibacter sp.]
MILQAATESDGTLKLAILTDTLDISNETAFREECNASVADSTGPVELDCSKLNFIDSSGVGALLHINKLLSAERRPVKLTGVQPKVITLLELMHVHRSFEIEAGN